MRRFSKGAVTSAIFILCGTPAVQAWELVTQEEAARAASNLQVEAATSPLEGAPVIMLEQPDISRPVKSPIAIRVKFQGTNINKDSLQVTYGYGLFAINLTQQILTHAHVSVMGLSADNAELPSGKHHITISISDSLGRVGKLTLDFTVT